MMSGFQSPSCFDRFVIVDLDGTLFDVSHRRHHLDNKDWDAFHSACVDDKVIVAVADLVLVLNQSINIILLTGRNEKYRHLTTRVLEDAGLDGYYEELIMRADDDFSQDFKFKIAALERRFGDREGVLKNVWFAIDDSEPVVEAFRNYGILTFNGG